MSYLIIVVAAIFSAYRVMRTQKLLTATLWLAVCSALTATLLYMLGAEEVAVIELSVGAGLVTVLFVYAFSIVGELTFDELTIIPRPLVMTLVIIIAATLSWFILPNLSAQPVTGEAFPFATALWHMRGLDVIVQIVLLFAGVMGLIGLISTGKAAAHPSLHKSSATEQEIKAEKAETL